MKLSVIVPTFNRAEVIERCLRSIFAQNLPFSASQMEVVLVDDGSTDDTADLVKSAYPQVNYVYQSNQGVSAARNAGIAVAQGDWIALLDSDDEWLPHKLAVQLDLVEKSELKICHTEEIWIRKGVRVNQMDKHKKRGGWIFEHCLPLCAMSPSSILIHRSVFEQVGVFNESLPACEDYDLWLRIAACYEVAFVEQACINKYGGHEDQLSRQYWGMDRFRVIALENCLTDPRVASHLSAEMAASARSMLIKKLNILLKGALKHQNRDLQDECREKLVRWGGVE